MSINMFRPAIPFLPEEEARAAEVAASLSRPLTIGAYGGAPSSAVLAMAALMRKEQGAAGLAVTPSSHQRSLGTSIGNPVRGETLVSEFLRNGNPNTMPNPIGARSLLVNHERAPAPPAQAVLYVPQRTAPAVQPAYALADAYLLGRMETLRDLGVSSSGAALLSPSSDAGFLPSSGASGLLKLQHPPKGGSLVGSGGNLGRQKIGYFDASGLSDPDPSVLANRRSRGGVTEPFPEKLHRMLKDAEDDGNTDVVSFFPHGRAFTVHKPDRFMSEIMPRYFRQSRISSFQRQLNLYGFTRIQAGPDMGGYYHELFLKGRPTLAVHMRRVTIKSKAKGQNGDNIEENGECPANPDFYAMAPIKKSEKVIP